MNFELTSEQWAKAKAWMAERSQYSGAIGGQFSFVFTPTSIGEIVSVVDSKSKEELNLTIDF